MNTSGYKRLVISASDDLLKKEYVDYTILEGIILHSLAFQNSSSAFESISKLKYELETKGQSYYGNEHVGLEINLDFCKPIDNLGSEDGLDGPLSWNIATPAHLQKIPTAEIFQLFDDWLKFLKAVEENPPQII